MSSTKTMELHIHALMHSCVNKQEFPLCFSLIQSKFTQRQLCASNWAYSSERDGASIQAASRPISSIILALVLSYVLWNRPGAKTRLNRKSKLHWEIRQGLCEEETLRIGKVGNRIVLQAQRTAWVSALRQEDIHWTESLQVWLRPRECTWGDARQANLCKVYGFWNLFQMLLKSLKNPQEES